MAFEFTERHAELLEDTHNKVSDIEIVLKGYNGKNGLLKQVATNTKSITRVWLTFAFIGGGGGVTLGVAKLIELVSH